MSAGAHPKVKAHANSRIRASPNYSLAARTARPNYDQAFPGPGKYGTPMVSQTLRRSQSWGFGSTDRMRASFPVKDSPGPGAYSWHEPNKYIQKAVMGTTARMSDKKASSPPPGAYTKESTLGKKSVTMAGRTPGVPAPTYPAPGAYTPSFSQVHTRTTVPSMSTNEDRGNSETFKVKSWKSGAPDPGRYNSPKAIGPNLIMATSSPNWSMRGRGRQMKSDLMAGPGPVLTDVSCFHR